MEINYTKYNAKSLLEALGNIDAEAYPDNYQNLTNEIASRKHEIQEFYAQQAIAKKQRWSRLLTAISVSQLFVALTALSVLLLSISVLSALEVVTSISVVLLNALSGIILYRRATKYYAIPYLNVALQTFAFGLGGMYFNYYGLGGAFLTFDWISESYNWLSLSFNLGGSLLQFSNEVELGFIQIDVLAFFYIWVIKKSLSQASS
ncbi:hypothetical protein NV104_004453 [Vibrio parahaemolyticus]|nr:hypothetical protein [Vibrio parahaemolyticus]EJG0014225.1 hypothetical protein [Vibrio parahaemolyticus]EJS9800998.1 hypothetical protein [Vibrio parahaemolyticus]